MIWTFCAKSLSLSAQYSEAFVYLQDECPLGKLFRPSIMVSLSPVHSISLFISPSGKQRQKKSGRGLPVSAKYRFKQ